MSDKDSTDDSSQNTNDEILLPQLDQTTTEEEEEEVPKTVQSSLAQKIWEASQGEIVRYQASLTEADLQRVRELAPMSEYKVKYFKPTGKTFTDPFGETEQEVEEEERILVRKKISQQQFRKIQEMRSKIRLNAQKPPKKQDPNLNAWSTYEYMAYCFFGLKPEEFKHLDWEEMRPILDACEERTARGLPSTQRPSNGPSTLPQVATGNLGVG
jgi:hypothetical protein